MGKKKVVILVATVCCLYQLKSVSIAIGLCFYVVRTLKRGYMGRNTNYREIIKAAIEEHHIQMRISLMLTIIYSSSK